MGILIFYSVALLMLFTGIGVVVFKNPVYGALCLIANMIGIALMFALMEAHFLAAVQVIVYAGAIMVLVLFVLMLLNVKTEERRIGQIVLAVCSSLIALCFFFRLAPTLQKFAVVPARPIGDVSTDAVGTVASIGRELYTHYIFVFEAASILIMVAIVGVVMIAKRLAK